MMNDLAELPYLDLRNVDGNAFVLIGRANSVLRRHLKNNGYGAEEINKAIEELNRQLTKGNYDDLLCVLMERFDVHV